MKKAKKFAAIILCIAMLLGMTSVCAGAINVGDTITHEITEENGEIYSVEYSYEGTFSVGENIIDERYEDQAFIFTAEQSGFYFVYSDDCGYNVAKEYSNGVAKDFSNSEWYFDVEDNFGDLYYLEEGETAFLLYHIGDTSRVELYIDYCGEVSEVNLTNKKDFYIKNYDTIVYDENKISVDFIEYEVLFTNGETYKNDKECVDTMILNEEFKDGENTLTLNILDHYEEEFIFNIYPIDYFVKSLEVENLEEYCVVTEYYNGQYSAKDFGETPVNVTVEYTDGSEETISYCNNNDEYINVCITLSNGEDYFIYSDVYEDDGVYYFDLGIGDTIYIKEECEVITADFAANSDYLTETISSYIEDLKFTVSYHLNSIPEATSFEDVIYHIEYLFKAPVNYISFIFDEIKLFITNAF